ncbi:MAG: hypothetical protein E6J34_01595 [Chloroflexi bacterium]|nr:MAG: hypothetical protein E6J34_01595 [Chloroflexota bacterium]
MQKLDVLIEENSFGSVRPVEVIGDAPVAELVSALVEELNLPRTNLSGKRLIYMLRQSAGGRILPAHTTLLASGVQPGSLLTLDAYAVDGTVADPLAAQRLAPNAADPTLYSAQTLPDLPALSDLRQGNASLQKSGKVARRAFLTIVGVGLALGGLSGVSYAGYRVWQTDTFNNLFSIPNKVTMQQTTVGNTPAHAIQPPTAAKSVYVFNNHQGIVRTVGWSSNGQLLASGADDTQVFIWNANGTILRMLKHQASVRALAWSPDNQHLVTAANNQITLFNSMNGQILNRSTHGHNGTINSLAWTPRGQPQVVSGANDKRAIVWNPTTNRTQTLFQLHTNPIEAVSWDASGQIVASSSASGVVRVWKAADGQEIHGFYQIGNVRLRTVAFSPVGMQLAVGADDGKVRIWNGTVCRQQQANTCADNPQILPSGNKAVRTLAWSPDGHFLAVGTDDGLLSVWYPAQSMQPLFNVQQSASIHSLIWSSDGKQLASASAKSVTLWNLM